MSSEQIRFLAYALALTIGLWAVPARSAEIGSAAKARHTELAREILADQTLSDVRGMARDLLKGSVNAGSGYGEVWTAVAIEAGLLTREEVARSLDQMVANVRAAGAGSIGLTLYPPYPEGFFKNPQMHSPYSYQNGGDWCWFGGRVIQALIKEGYLAEAYRELRPMVERVKQAGGFHEWWSRDNQPRGSGEFRGSAGVLGRAIELLQVWAEHNRGPSPKGHSGEGRP